MDQQDTSRLATFINDASINIKSGVGVTFVTTLEPFRAEVALQQVAMTLNRQFHSWDMVRGWATINLLNPEADPVIMKDTASALVALNRIDESKDLCKTGSDVLVMHWPQFAMKSMPPVLQKLANLSRSLPETKKRLFLLVPVGTEIPVEIREMVSILNFDTPGRTELESILLNCLEDLDDAKRPRFTPEAVEAVINIATGLTELEAEAAFSKAMVRHRELLPHIPLDRFMETVAAAKTEAIKRSDVLELMPSGSPDDIGGLEALKEWISVTGQCMTQEAVDAGVDRPKGVFLAGPPGTGKSASAKAIAGVLQLPLIKFDVSRVFSSLVGSTEQRIKQTLKLIESMAPCVALIDEVDKIFNVNSGGGDSGVGSRVLGTLLTFMQDSNAGIFWVVTANRVEGLPPELLRKGRLDETFAVTVPNEQEREVIFGIHLRKRKVDPETIGDLSEAVAASAGYVPAELEAAVKEAVKLAYVNNTEVTGALLAEQLGLMKPLSEAFKDQFDAMQAWAENNARPASLQPLAMAPVQATPAQRRRSPVVTSGARRSRSIEG